MEISQITGAGGAGPQGSGQASSASSLTSDFNTFLKMLTVQAQNQDPLNPLDATDYATQLATFSSVEQQVVTNDLLRNMASAIGASTLSELRGWVGSEVLATGAVAYGGSEIEVYPQVQAGASAADLVVHDDRGDEVARLSAPLDGSAVIWTGVSSDGATLPHAHYSFHTESFVDGQAVATRDALTYRPVTEARTGTDGVPILSLDGGGERRASDIAGLRVKAR